MLNLKEYLLQKFEKSIEVKSQLERQFDNISDWRNVRPEVIKYIAVYTPNTRVF